MYQREYSRGNPALEAITDVERGKMINYLKVTGLKLGLLLNFKHSRLQWERIVLTR